MSGNYLRLLDGSFDDEFRIDDQTKASIVVSAITAEANERLDQGIPAQDLVDNEQFRRISSRLVFGTFSPEQLSAYDEDPAVIAIHELMDKKQAELVERGFSETEAERFVRAELLLAFLEVQERD